MKIILLMALISVSAADRPSSNYRAPLGGFSNGFGALNGAPSNGYEAPPSNRYGPPSGYGQDELAALLESIPGGGVPGEDYPILASPPNTGFSCDDQAVQGYYADTASEAGCQVFHICQDRARRRQQDSFLCPNGTIFNQQYLVCDWWFNVDCAEAENFYSVNELIGVVPYGGYGPSTNGNGNRYGSNGNGKGGNGNGNRYSSNGNGRNGNAVNGNGNLANSNGGNGNGASNGYGPPVPPPTSYGAPF
ncbi:pro-resilin-like [Homarus americanus]|uniref:U-scoloptoxin(01)-Cw1a-like 4 n=1 Tax=Homarus americanus TaxID=6706 RepID=A0A8J5MTM7_HOMAM|nr:pro-resilin-like [Homarus americanus]KAG7162967.1 U-scoloptoxin(01)-Cw1a-like 4 [Homarus americanus]